MKLKLEHLSPYLPYNLKCKIVKPLSRHNNKIMTLQGLVKNDKGSNGIFSLNSFYLDEFKPILRPLSNLPNQKICENELWEQCKDIDENLDYICEFDGNLFKTSLSYKAVSILIMYGFDVFGLIKDKLAQNILELERGILIKIQQ